MEICGWNKARAAGKFTSVHDAWWAVRKVPGDAEGPHAQPVDIEHDFFAGSHVRLLSREEVAQNVGYTTRVAVVIRPRMP